ncbi:MAG: hypothetical protein SFT94_02145 [Pseudanabaenaceae cyanobacterium bins.68]|nr:hypothetical protein [Pseudanabaenaceae cyanobacterium bins.68]
MAKVGMGNQNIWIQGESLSGKTDLLIECFINWTKTEPVLFEQPQIGSHKVLALAVNSRQSRAFIDRLRASGAGKYPIECATPRSFLRDQVLLFYPLLGLDPQFPIVVRVENEQELATNLWQDLLDNGKLAIAGLSSSKLVRRLLDFHLMAANSNIPLANLAEILTVGLSLDGEAIVAALIDWRAYCWQKGLLTYGVIAELYGQYLLPNPVYQKYLTEQIRYLLVDDADEYPGLLCDLCQFLLQDGAKAAFSFNPQGAVRLGLEADPTVWLELATGCEVVVADRYQTGDLQVSLPLVNSLLGESWNDQQPLSPQPGFYCFQTLSRAQLLRLVAEQIATAIAANQVQPSEVAVIAPGLDRIAVYSLTEILRHHQIEVFPLQDQSPLSLSPQVRSLLTLLAMIYPDLGELVNRDRVAEMLTCLANGIDPVRAGLIADRCFVPSLSQPQLSDFSIFQDWQRLGYRATQAYVQFRSWINQSHSNPLLTLEQAINQFLLPTNPSYALLKTLSELLETAQHYWQLGDRLNWSPAETLARFIQLIWQGTVTANPYAPHPPSSAVTLATIYQYRMARNRHKWQFWLDAGSILWLEAGASSLAGASLFKRDWHGQKLDQELQQNQNLQRLQHLANDLIHRAEDRIYLCFSDLGINGEQQEGVLASLLDLVPDPIIFSGSTLGLTQT